MELHFKAREARTMSIKAREILAYRNELYDIQNTIKEAANKGNLEVFTDFPLSNFYSIEKDIKKANYKITKRGNTTVNNRRRVIVKIEW